MGQGALTSSPLFLCQKRTFAVQTPKLRGVSSDLWQFEHQLVKFFPGPGAGGAGAPVALHAERHRELGYVVAVRRFDHDDEVGFAGSQIDLHDLDADLLREVARHLRTLGSIFDPADTLIRPVT